MEQRGRRVVIMEGVPEKADLNQLTKKLWG